MNFVITGTGSAHPAKAVANAELAGFLETSDEWIRTRTGIAQRYVLTDESLCDIALSAAQRALADAGAEAGELDLIICATMRGDFVTPSLACQLQKRLGATCPAFDVNAACTGFLYALDIAAGYFARGCVKKVLIVAAEAVSRLLNWQDRSTAVLFGDGAGAAVLQEGEGLLGMRLFADGDTAFLRIPVEVGNSPYAAVREAPYLSMQGGEVYRFAVGAVCDMLTKAAQEAGVGVQDLDRVFLHQANRRIIETAIERLGIAAEKCATNIACYGNTSSASLLILMDEERRAGRLLPGELVALCAFGGGLTAGACVLRWV